MSRTGRRFLSWRDTILTPLIEVFILALPIFLTLHIHARFHLSLFVNLLTFYGGMVIVTLVVLKLIRLLMPIQRGIFSLATGPRVFYGWRLHSFLCSTNLFLPYQAGFVPPILKKYFYRLLGANIGGGAVSIGGRLLDPYLITLGESVMIGDDTLLIPHNYSVGSQDLLVLDRIDLQKGAVVGARCTIMPGVTVGENSMVRAMSLVPMNTKIPPNEIWEGIPARKVADVDRPIFEVK